MTSLGGMSSLGLGNEGIMNFFRGDKFFAIKILEEENK